MAAWSTFFGFLALLPWAGWQAMHEPFAPSMQSLAVAVSAAMFGDQLGLSFVIGVAAVLVGLRPTLKAT